MTTNCAIAIKEAETKRMKELAEDIIKYQNFKSSIAIKKMRAQHLVTSSRYNYITCGRHYLKTGNKYKNIVGSNFYKYLQEAIDNHVQPLMPNFEERKREIKRDYTKKDINPPITKIINSNKKITTNIEYGIKIGNKIILQKNEDCAKAFLDGIKFLNQTEAKIVTLEINELK